MRLAVAMLVGSGATAAAQTVRGTVVDDVDRRPVAGVLVTLVQANGSDIPPGVRTDSAGRFVLYAARQGTYRVRAVRIGYRPSLGEPVSLDIGGLVVVQIAVGANPRQLAPVRVVERRQLSLPELMSAAGFDLRRTRGQGRFLDRELLASYKRESAGEVFTAYLRSLADITVSETGATSILIRDVPRRGPCAPEIYIDGSRVPNGSAIGSLEALAAEDLYGIEVYRRGELPPPSLAGLMGLERFQNESCAIAVWTRKGAEGKIAPRSAGQSGIQVLKGTVIDAISGKPVHGMRVQLVTLTESPVSAEVRSDTAGEFRIQTTRIGQVRFHIDRGGKNVMGPIFRLVPEELLLVRLFVSDKPVEAPMGVVSRVVPDTLSPNSRMGFAYRRERGLIGLFLDPSDLERFGARTVGPALLRLDGIGVDSVGSLLMTRKSEPACVPTVLRDGTPVSAGDIPTASITASQLLGVEIYFEVASVPLAFTDRPADCGLIAVWTRTPGG